MQPVLQKGKDVARTPTCNFSSWGVGKKEQEDQGFKVITGYIVSLRQPALLKILFKGEKGKEGERKRERAFVIPVLEKLRPKD